MQELPENHLAGAMGLGVLPRQQPLNALRALLQGLCKGDGPSGRYFQLWRVMGLPGVLLSPLGCSVGSQGTAVLHRAAT